MSRPVVCAVGTTDPWNAAGLGLDLLALWECGARPVSVVAAVSAQDAAGLRDLVAIPPATVAAQFAALAGAPIAAYRVGALAGAANVLAVAAALARNDRPVVYDPVLAASAGGTFADAEARLALRGALIPRARILTPNAAEAAALLDVPVPATRAEFASAAVALRALGAQAVLVTGGDLPGAPLDVLADADGVLMFEEPRIPGELRGTGCLLAAALAAALAQGKDVREAVREARAFVRRKLSAAVRLGPFRVAY